MTIPASANPLLSVSAAGAGGYQIERSLRFNSADSSYLSRTPASAGNRKTWTYSFWAKLSYGATDYFLRNVNSGSSDSGYILFSLSSLGDIRLSGWATNWLQTTAVFRDSSAWYHILLAVDTTQATASDRLKLYVNGNQITTFSVANYPSQNLDLPINATGLHDIGVSADFYLADLHLIDGQALDPTSFGEFDDNGVWQPIEYTGTYPGNSFHLPFSDNSTAAALGTDTSGAGNSWTVNNISVAAGAGNDSLVDTPTSYGTDTGAGGEVRGNYATLNPLAKGTNVTLANGNLDASTSTTTGYGTVLGTIGVSSGKWYWEFTGGSGTIGVGLGIAEGSKNLNTYLGTDVGYEYYSENGNKYSSAGGVAYGSSWGSGDVIGVALDVDSGTLAFYKNGVSQGTAFTGLTNTPYFPAVADSSGTNVLNGSINFGQRPFAYTAPSGYKALCTTNLPTPVVAKPSEVMDVALYTGNGSTQTISGLGFSPDLVWCKVRGNGVAQHVIYDSVRGIHKRLTPNGTTAETDVSPYGVTAFLSTGFTVADNFNGNYEINGDPAGTYGTGGYAAWTWDAGSSTVTNTDGSITSQVRANASAGFSIVTYTGTGATGGTVGHGLGVAPGMIIIKNRDRSIVWVCYHSGIGSGSFLLLNTTDAKINDATYWGAGITSTTFGLQANNASGINYLNEDHIAYCFAPVDGYSSFGSYVGNGSSDGVFVYTGMRPRWIMWKASSYSTANTNWIIFDTSRSPYNKTLEHLAANSSAAEAASTPTGEYIDICSNGFKLRYTDANNNASGQTYIYAAFAESPFAYSRAR